MEYLEIKNNKYVYCFLENVYTCYYKYNGALYKVPNYRKEGVLIAEYPTLKEIQEGVWSYTIEKWKTAYVINLGMPKLGSFALGNFIVLNGKSTLLTIKHEYGHILQREKYGRLKYIKTVAIPSFTRYWKRKIQKLFKPKIIQEDYFAIWYEAEADKLGGIEKLSD